jgi:ABC-type antimicrobial peptide transport system permease subunit
VVPAIIGDSATAIWKLKKRVGPDDGDRLDYTDERGNRFQVKLVGALPHRVTVFQGRLLIADRDFTRRYPSEAGHRAFLVDVPAGRETRVIRYLSRKLEKVGLDVVPAVERLEQFYRVESTYLMMFLVLGGLGLLLGTAGLGILVLRNVLERRSELALLRAVGYTGRQARGVVLAEHRVLLGAGLVTGTIAAAIAVLPSAARPGVHVPWGLLAGFALGTLVLSLIWIGLATRLALRAPLVPALRDE